MNVKRSFHPAVRGKSVLDAVQATTPTTSTKASEYADVAVNMGTDSATAPDILNVNKCWLADWRDWQEPASIMCARSRFQPDQLDRFQIDFNFH